MKTKIFLLGLLTFLFLISFSYAETPYNNCCELTSSGDQCVSLDDSSQCIGNYADSDCKITTFCKTGCCYNPSSGDFDKNTLENNCPYNWEPSDSSCSNIPSLSLGCCVLPNDKFMTSEKRCEVISQELGILNDGQVDWRQEIDEIECSFIPEPTGKGACVIGDFCKHSYFSECSTLQGEFFEGFLCTSQEEGINRVCEPTDNTICEGDKVYFKDSCENLANIYDSNKIEDQTYWENFIEEENSCGANDPNGNANSASCGNCNRFDGSKCSLPDLGEDNPAIYGDYFCKDTSCHLDDGTVYKNGESWCVYDGKIGEGDDSVGSLHFIKECKYGEVVSNQCADYRNTICKQVDITTPGSTEVISGAKCIPNSWRECIGYNEESEGNSSEVERLCNQNDQCQLKILETGDVVIKVCSPNYPGGFKFLENEDSRISEEQADICSLATQSCTYQEKRSSPFSSYQCKRNCGCKEPEFTEEMNTLCRSLGDCGASINFRGEYTSEGFLVNGHGAANLRDSYRNYLIEMANLDLNQGTEIIDITDESRLNETYSKGYRGQFIFIRNEFGTRLTYLGGNDYGVGVANQIGRGYAALLWTGWTFGFGWIGGGDFLETIGWTNTRSRTIYFTCNEWTQPLGGENCDACNNGDVPCSEYRCSSLGSACRIENKGTENEICIWSNRQDNIAPQIDLSGDENYELNENSDASISINPLGANCFNPYEEINITLITNEYARCKYSEEQTEFENMIPINSLWSKEHKFSTYFIDPSEGESRGLDISEDKKLYVLCVDDQGNPTSDFFEINMCVYEGPDRTIPRINSFTPESGFKTKYQKENELVTFYTNKPADCKWDSEDTTYNSMQNQATCLNDIETRTAKGYSCQTTLPLNSDSNTFYFRCLDQPWFAEPDENGLDRSSERKESTRTEVYHLNRIENKIQIDSINPNENMDSTTLLKVIDVEVETSGGGEMHTCYYSKTSFDKNLIEMLQSRRVGKHIQPQVNFFVGENKLFVQCTDETGDKVREEVNFQLNYGTSSVASLISRVWQDEGNLNIITTEEVECKASTKECNFDWEDAESIGTSFFHDLRVKQGKTYFIKCLDTEGNIPNSCSLKVVPA